MMDLNDAKKLAKSNLAEAAGKEFRTPKGVIGKILPNLSEHKKAQAELTCSEANCTNVHVREVSDWHQSDKCRDHRKTRSRSGGSSGGSTGVNLGAKMVVKDTDPPELRAKKEAFNKELDELKALEAEQRKAEQAAKAEERKKQQEAERVEREAKQLEERRKALSDRMSRIKTYAASVGAEVSQKTLDEVAETEEELETEQTGE